MDFHFAVKRVESLMSFDGATMRYDDFCIVSPKNFDRDEFGTMSSKSVMSGNVG